MRPPRLVRFDVPPRSRNMSKVLPRQGLSRKRRRRPWTFCIRSRHVNQSRRMARGRCEPTILRHRRHELGPTYFFSNSSPTQFAHATTTMSTTIWRHLPRNRTPSIRLSVHRANETALRDRSIMAPWNLTDRNNRSPSGIRGHRAPPAHRGQPYPYPLPHDHLRPQLCCG